MSFKLLLQVCVEGGPLRLSIHPEETSPAASWKHHSPAAVRLLEAGRSHSTNPLPHRGQVAWNDSSSCFANILFNNWYLEIIFYDAVSSLLEVSETPLSIGGRLWRNIWWSLWEKNCHPEKCIYASCSLKCKWYHCDDIQKLSGKSINPLASEFGETLNLRLMVCRYYSFIQSLLTSCVMASTMLEVGNTIMYKTRTQPCGAHSLMGDKTNP